MLLDTFHYKVLVRINFHGDELHPLGGAELGAEIRAEAVSHLEEVSRDLLTTF